MTTAATNFKSGSADERGPKPSLSKLFDRLPPHSLEAEMSLLGSLIIDPMMMSEVIPTLAGPDAFYKEAHAEVFSCLLTLYDQKQSGDLVQLVSLLQGRASLTEVGGVDYLEELASAVPSAVNAPHYARIVSDTFQLRQLIDAAGQILYDAYNTGGQGPDTTREVLDVAEQRIFEIANLEQSSDPQRLADMLQDEIDRLEALLDNRGVSGLSTGYSKLDEMLSGMQPGELIIVAARPSMGKTSLALNMAEQMALGGAPSASHTTPQSVGFFSLEMSKSAVAQRLLSARSGVSMDRMRKGYLGEMSKEKGEEIFRSLISASSELREAPIVVDDSASLTVMGLRARARRMVAKHQIKAIMVDYLQLMTAPGSARESRQVEVSAISRGIKALARELNVPIVCLAQLNRGAEQREGHRPRMSDLRESGSIEQDADVIILLHREAYYHKGDPSWDPNSIEFDELNREKLNIAELIIAKQRNGPTGIVKLTWDERTTRFRDFAGSGYDDDSGFAGSNSGFGGGAGGGGGGGAPFEPGDSTFSGRPKTGPEAGFRDGGGPNDDDDLQGLPV